MDEIKQKIEEVVSKLKSDPAKLESFKSDPKGAIKELSGVDVPDEILDKVVTGVKGALAGDNIADAVGKIKGLF